MTIDRKDAIRIIEWRLENWQNDNDVWDKAPEEIKATPDELNKFLIEMAVRVGEEKTDVIRIHQKELERLKKEKREENSPRGGDQYIFDNRYNQGNINVTFDSSDVNIILSDLEDIKSEIARDESLSDKLKKEAEQILGNIGKDIQKGNIDIKKIMEKFSLLGKKLVRYAPSFLEFGTKMNDKINATF